MLLAAAARAAAIDEFVASAEAGTLTPGVIATSLASGEFPIDGRHSCSGWTALHAAVVNARQEVVAALLSAGANPEVASSHGRACVWLAACISTAETLQLLIDGGGSVNTTDNDGEPPLIALVRYDVGDLRGRLDVLLSRPELDVDAEFEGKSAEQWAVDRSNEDVAEVIAEEVLFPVYECAVSCVGLPNHANCHHMKFLFTSRFCSLRCTASDTIERWRRSLLPRLQHMYPW
jgi:hypothetical protein